MSNKSVTNTGTANRLAKNTAFMYARMILQLLISLYTSRVVLQQLGVDNYGIYNVVGSVVGMFASLRLLFTSSTQRFLNYEMGRGKDQKLQLVFNMSTYINIGIAVVFVICAETIGLWFLNEKINIDPSRYFAACVVFQISVANCVLDLVTTPYDAVIIAHEKMNYYAYMSVFESIIRLVVVFLLQVILYDKLIVYAILCISVTFLIRSINAIYCKFHFKESHYKFLWDKDIFKQMTAFAGWNFLGNSAYTLTQSGINMVLNVFGGPAVNAARGIAYRVKAVIDNFTNNINIVVTPFTIRTFAEGNKERFFKTIFYSSKIMFCVQLTLAIPLCFLTYEILSLWLGQVPEYTVEFILLVMVHSLIRAVHHPIDTLFKATGNIKWYQITEGIVTSLPVIVSYFLLKTGFAYYSVFVSIIVIEVINFSLIIPLASRIAGLNKSSYLRNVISPCLVCFFIALILWLINKHFVDIIYITIVLAILTMLVCASYMFFFGLNNEEKSQLINLIKSKIKKNDNS